MSQQRDSFKLSKDLEIGESIVGNLKYFDMYSGEYGPTPKLVLENAAVLDENNQVSNEVGDINCWVTPTVGAKLIGAGLVEQRTKQDGEEYYKVTNETEVTIVKGEGSEGKASYTVYADGEELKKKATAVRKPASKGRQSGGSAGSRQRPATRATAPAGDPRTLARKAKAAMVAALLLGKQIAEQGFAISDGQVTAIYIDFMRSGLDFEPLVKPKAAAPPAEPEAQPEPEAEEEQPRKPPARRQSSRSVAAKKAKEIRDQIDDAAESLDEMPAALAETEDDELPF